MMGMSHVGQRRRARRCGRSGSESGTTGKKAAPRARQHWARRRGSTRPTEATPGSTRIRREVPPFDAAWGGSDRDGPGMGAGGGHRRQILPSRGANDEQLISTTIVYASPDCTHPLEAADYCSIRDHLVWVTGLHCSFFFYLHTVSLPSGTAYQTALRSV
jgi:hypothetical protein